jgi:rhodanese-related sulfurtransferase
VGITSITPRELAELCGDGRKIDLIDVRTPLEYREVHAVDARNVPLSQLDPTALLRDRQAAPEDPLYFICRSGGRGQQACEKLVKAGHAKVVNVEGGTLAWAAAGLPVARGEKAMSLERQVRVAAGALVCLGVVLAALVHPAFVALSALVGAGLVYSGVTNTCGMGLLLAHMPWNRGGESSCGCEGHRDSVGN